MDVSVSTVGNATLVVRCNRTVVLATDLWMGGEDDAYFGSWNLNHVIPEDLVQDIDSARYIWLSHGHPRRHRHPVQQFPSIPAQ